MKRIPVIRNGIITISDSGLPEKDLKNTAAAINAIINSIPPQSSCFQAIIRISARIRNGILCINNPASLLAIDPSPSNASKENISINIRARIVKILGVQ
jgi:hypothetical protein